MGRSPDAEKVRSARRHAESRYCVNLEKEQRGNRCEECGGVFHPCQLDFAHKDEHRSTKNKLLRRRKSQYSMTQLARISTETFAAEVEKCRLLCANCHRMETFLGKHWIVEEALA
jgi:hypothetical protein